MSHLVLGILAIIAGAIFCFRGNLALRAVIAIWGGFVGFGLGAAVVAWFTQEPPLSGPAGWVGAVIGALLLGVLAYALYAVAVILAMGSVGYGLGTAVASWFGLSPRGAVVAGVVGAIVLIIVALITNMPALLLILVSAVGGAAAIVAGIALLAGLAPSQEADLDAWSGALTEHWWLSAVFAVLAVAGIVLQWRHRNKADLRAGYRRRST